MEDSLNLRDQNLDS